MGMRSSFDWEEIEVKDWKGLEEFIKVYMKHYGKNWDVSSIKDEKKIITNIITEMIVDKDNEVKEKKFSFESWDNIKLISYYYVNQLVFFEGVAPFIEGEVHWSFENNEEDGWVEFRDGKCTLHLGFMEYIDKKPIEQMGEEDLKSIPEELKNHLALNQLAQSNKTQNEGEATQTLSIKQ
jgi:hypothetical protein